MAAQGQEGAYGVTVDPGIQLGDIPSLHEFIHCLHSQVPNVNMLAYAQNSVLTELVNVPGSSVLVLDPPSAVMRAKNHTLIVLRRLYQCFWNMHQAGLSLGGLFGPANLLIYSSQTITIRITGIHLTSFSQVNGSLDYTRLVTCIEEFFMLHESVPSGIQAWLDLIRGGVTGYEYLIRYNVALMEPAQAFHWLMDARGIIERLRTRDPVTFSFVLWIHDDLNNWDTDSYCLNTRLAQTRDFIDRRTGQRTVFEHDVTGILTLARNNSQHASRFMERLMVLILEYDFPGLVARLQHSLFRAGLLPLFNLEATMG